jgi:hypothetical protein
MSLRQGFNPGCNTLMSMTASKLGQAHTVSLYQPDAGFLCAFHELTHSGIAPGGFKVDFNN